MLTSLPVRTRQATEELDWYAQRWKIETFHKILKSGCRAEKEKLRTAERLVNLIAILCILSWRVFWVTMLNRTRPGAFQRSSLLNASVEKAAMRLPWKALRVSHFPRSTTSKFVGKHHNHQPSCLRHSLKLSPLSVGNSGTNRNVGTQKISNGFGSDKRVGSKTENLQLLMGEDRGRSNRPLAARQATNPIH